MTTWSTAHWLARKAGSALPDSHDSGTVFEKVAQAVTGGIRNMLKTDLQGAAAFAISLDEKDIYLLVMVHYIGPPTWKVQSKLLTYRELPGSTAVDIAECVKKSFAELDIDLSGNSRLVCYGADGASVMGTRRAFGLPGNNVARLLQELVEGEAGCRHRMLVTHCSAHRLQLAISDALHKDDYLSKMESMITKLYRRLRAHPHDMQDLVFWGCVTEEQLLSALGTGKARWLSLREPMQKLWASYHSILAHLHFSYQIEKDREAKKHLAEVFQHLADWKFRITLGGV